MSEKRIRNRVPFSIRDTAKRKKAVLSQITKIISARYVPVKYYNINPLEIKQSSLVTNCEWYITNYLKHYVHLEGTNNGMNKYNNYVSYTPIKLIDLLEEVLCEIFGQSLDLDDITADQIVKAERYFQNVLSTEGRPKQLNE